MKNNKRLIAKIFNGEEVVMTIDRNMLSCEFGALDRGNLTDVVNWGIYANRGSISFVDNIGYFNNQNVNSTDIKKYLVKFYLAKNQETLISTFKVDTVDFDDETRRVDIQLIGRVIDLQKQPSSQKEQKDVFHFYSKTTEFLAGLLPPTGAGEDAIFEYYRDYPSQGLQKGFDLDNLEYTYIYCPYLTFGTLWDRMTKICQSTMCRIFDNENGYPVISGERPTKNTIIIKPKNIISISKSQFVKVANSSIELTNRVKYENKGVSQASKKIEITPRTVDYGTEKVTVYDVSNVDSYGVTSSQPLYPPTLEEIKSGKIWFESVIKIPYKTYDIDSVKIIEKSEILLYSDSTYTDIYKELPPDSIGTVIQKTYDSIYIKKSVNVREVYDDVGSIFIKGFDYSFNLSYFEDETNETITNITDENEEAVKIDSNDFIQKKSYYDDGIENLNLGEHILNETARRYAKGRECFEIECLFNEYYDENGNKVFDKDDLSNHFEKYDVIIPYVMKKGQTVPLRVNEDGTPKKFRIIGISYSYDGLLKQKLSVQEERYDVD